MAYDAQAYRRKLGGYKRIPASKIIAWIEGRFEYKTRKNGNEYCINNPFDGDTGFNFNINPEMGVCNDWRGNEWAGPINPETGKRNCSFLKFVRLYNDCSYREALESVLGGSEDISSFLRPGYRATDQQAKRKVSVALPDGAIPLSASEDKQAAILRKWLHSRGYTDDEIKSAELCHIGMDVYWPYYEFDTLVYWQSRSRLNKRFDFPSTNIYDQSGNVVGVTDGSRSDFLYGFDSVEPASYLIITEAIFDQNILGDQVLASGGAALNDNQIKKIRILGPKSGIILSPDNDSAGIKSIVNNNDLLARQGFKVYYSLPPTGFKDWNELFTSGGMTKAEIRAYHDDHISPLSRKELVKLRKRIYKK